MKNQHKYNYQLEVVNPFKVEGEVVSSSKIRTFLSSGDISKVNTYLGNPYKIRGQIVKGNSIGRDLGFPTANMEIKSINQIIPKNGVYCINVKIYKETYKGMCNIGFNPTISDAKELSLEVHIFDYNNFNLYGKYTDIEFVDYVRSETKFDNLKLLKTQLAEDEKYCKNL